MPITKPTAATDAPDFESMEDFKKSNAESTLLSVRYLKGGLRQLKMSTPQGVKVVNITAKGSHNPSRPVSSDRPTSLNVDDYDWTAYDDERGRVWGRITEIIHGSATGGPDSDRLLLFCKTSNGRKTSVITRPLTPGEKSERSIQAAPAPAANTDLTPLAFAAFGWKRLSAANSHSPNAGWFAECLAAGRDHCFELVSPILAKHPIPASAVLPHEKMIHIVKMITEHLEPKAVDKFSTQQAPQTNMSTQTTTVTALIQQGKFEEAWAASPALQNEFRDAPLGVDGHGQVGKAFAAYARSIGRTRATSEFEALQAAYDQRRASKSTGPAPAQTVDVQALIDAGKYEEAFKADAAINAEFGTAGVFAAFCRANKGGKIRHTPRK